MLGNTSLTYIFDQHFSGKNFGEPDRHKACFVEQVRNESRAGLERQTQVRPNRERRPAAVASQRVDLRYRRRPEVRQISAFRNDDGAGFAAEPVVVGQRVAVQPRRRSIRDVVVGVAHLAAAPGHP